MTFFTDIGFGIVLVAAMVFLGIFLVAKSREYPKTVIFITIALLVIIALFVAYAYDWLG